MADDPNKPGSDPQGAPKFPFSPQDALDFMQRMWNPLGIAMPGFAAPAGAAPAAPGAQPGMPFPHAGCDVRSARSGRDRPQDRRAAHHRELAHDERVHDADEHQDDGAAEGIARGDARRAAHDPTEPMHHALLRLRLAVRVARAAGARAQGARLRAQGAFVHGRRHPQAGVRGAQSAPPRAGDRRRRLRALRIERDRRISRRRLSGPRRSRCSRATRASARSCAGSSPRSTTTSTRRPIPWSTRRSRRSRRSAMPRGSQPRSTRCARRSRSSPRYMRGDYLAGRSPPPTSRLYPMVAFLDRCATQAARLRAPRAC